MTDYTALKERLNRVESFLDDGPWTNEQFSEVMAGGGRDYGGMIMAADGESIVAQCVVEDNLNGIIALRNMVPQLAEAITTLERQLAEARDALVSIGRYYDCPVMGGDSAASCMREEVRQALKGTDNDQAKR